MTLYVWAVIREINNVWALGDSFGALLGGDHYPFNDGDRHFFQEAVLGRMHLNEKRLNWVKEKINASNT